MPGDGIPGPGCSQSSVLSPFALLFPPHIHRFLTDVASCHDFCPTFRPRPTVRGRISFLTTGRPGSPCPITCTDSAATYSEFLTRLSPFRLARASGDVLLFSRDVLSGTATFPRSCALLVYALCIEKDSARPSHTRHLPLTPLALALCTLALRVDVHFTSRHCVHILYRNHLAGSSSASSVHLARALWLFSPRVARGR